LAALAGATGQPLVIRRVPLSSLHQDPANARSHPERNLASIRASLARFGQAEPLVVLKGAIRVIGGNGRLVAMQSLGWTECDIVELELSPVEAAALGIALNRTAELAEWDPKALAAVVESLRTENALEGIGFDAREIDKLIAQAASLDSLVDSIAPAPPDRATTRPGDLWILGSHRLLCGDSSDRASLERLLAGQRIQLVNTDPPYNVAVEPRSNNAIAVGLDIVASNCPFQASRAARQTGTARAGEEQRRSRSAMDLGTAEVRISWPLGVMRTSSSMRMPMPRQRGSTVSSSSAM
jgi:ParB-like chromosome segregation protein Spo0J